MVSKIRRISEYLKKSLLRTFVSNQNSECVCLGVMVKWNNPQELNVISLNF